MINKRQAILLVCICALSTKLQRLPNIVALGVANDGWLVLLALGLVDFLVLWLAIWFFRRFNAGGGLNYALKKTFGTFLTGFVFFVLSIYFIIKTIMPFEALHDLFANILFDQIDYWLFGIMLLFLIAYVAVRGLRVIGRQCEIFALLIGLGIVGVVALGLFSADLTRVLPIYVSNVPESLISEFIKDSVWFGDYILLFAITGLVSLKGNEKLGWNLAFPYAMVQVVIVPLCYAIYYSLYGNVAVLQPNAISTLTQFSLLRLDIGRVDWFLVLFEQIATLISASAYICISAFCFCYCFKIKKPAVLCVVFPIVIYLLDVTLFVNISSSVFLFREFTFVYILAVNILVPLLAFVATVAGKIRRAR